MVEKGSHDQNRALSLVEKTACVFPTHRGVEGFVINGWDLSNLGYSPYMTNLGDKSHIIIIRDVFHDGTVVYRGPYSTKPSDKLRLI